jgi:hypothetical protein
MVKSKSCASCGKNMPVKRKGRRCRRCRRKHIGR